MNKTNYLKKIVEKTLKYIDQELKWLIRLNVKGGDALAPWRTPYIVHNKGRVNMINKALEKLEKEDNDSNEMKRLEDENIILREIIGYIHDEDKNDIKSRRDMDEYLVQLESNMNRIEKLKNN